MNNVYVNLYIHDCSSVYMYVHEVTMYMYNVMYVPQTEK